MELETYSRHLATFLIFAMSQKQQDRGHAVESLKAIYEDRESSDAFRAFCDEAGIEVLKNANYSVLSVFPSSGNSPFGYNSSDIQKLSAGNNKSDMSAFALLCIIATFYPTREALNKGVREEVTVEKVIGMINRMTAYADKTKESYGEEEVTILADRFRKLSDDIDTAARPGLKSTYVFKGLDNLENAKFITSENGYYLPTESLRLLANSRLQSIKTKLARILSEFHDRAELEEGE